MSGALISAFGSAVYQGSSYLLTSSVAKTVGTAIACTVGQKIIYAAADWIGRKAYSLTGGRVSVSKLVPEAVKAPCRELGDFLLMRVIAPASDYVPSCKAITKHLPNSMHYPPFLTVFACPGVEEGVYRLPAQLLFNQIDKVDALAKPLIAVCGLSVDGSLVIKGVVTLGSAIGFTYGHERASGVNPHNPGRAAALLASGVFYTIISSQFGFTTAVLTHSLNNLAVYFPVPGLES